MKITKVVSSSAIEQLTREGWELRQILDRAQRVHLEPVCIKPAGNGVNNDWSAAQYGNEIRVLTDPLFVVEKEQEVQDREAALLERALKAEGELHVANANVEADKQVYDRNVKTLTEDVRREREIAEIRLKSLQGTQGELNEARQRLMRVRAAIGDLKWREIFAEVLA